MCCFGVGYTKVSIRTWHARLFGQLDIHTPTHTLLLQVLGEEPSGLCELVRCPVGHTGPNGNQSLLSVWYVHPNINLKQAYCSLFICSFFAGGPCDVCATGKFKATAGNDDCKLCDAGKYGPTAGNDKEMDCMPCLAGTYSINPGSNSSSTCLPCPAGTYSGPATSQCVKCSAGKYSSTLGSNTSDSCLSCPANSTSPVGCTNASFCICKAGFKKIESEDTDELVTTNSVRCGECEAGKYKGVVGSATSCQDCDPGTSSDKSAADSSSYCVTCPTGETNNKSGATECDCVDGWTRDCNTKVTLHVHAHAYVCMRMCERLCFLSFIQRVHSLYMYLVT